MPLAITGRADRLAVLALLLLVMGSWLPRLKGPIDLRWDAAVYYILGTSLAEGKGYRLLNEPGEIPAVLYPPLLPAIVAAHQRVLGATDPVKVGPWLRGFFCLLFAVFVVSTYALLRRAARPPYAFVATFVCTLTFLSVWLSDRCYTDLPFAVSVVAFALVSGRSSGTASEIAAWTSAAAAFLLRTAGVALLLAWVAESVLQRRFRRAAFRLILALLPVAAWQLYVHQTQKDEEYGRPSYAYQRADYNIYNVTYNQLFSLRDHLDPSLGKATPQERVLRVPSALPRLVVEIGGAISAPRQDWERAIERVKTMPVLKHVVPWRSIAATMTLLGGLSVAGLLLALWQREWRLPVTLTLYLAALATMPLSYFGELPRYLSVVSPVVMVFALRAASELYRRRHLVPPLVRIGCGALAAALTGGVLAVNVFALVRGYTTEHREVIHEDWNGRRVEYRLFSFESDYEDLDTGLLWLTRHAVATDIVASTTPHWVFLRTGLKTVLPPFERNPARANELLDSVPVRYVIVLDWLSRRYAPATEPDTPYTWRVVFSNRQCTIYERVPTSSPTGVHAGDEAERTR